MVKTKEQVEALGVAQTTMKLAMMKMNPLISQGHYNKSLREMIDGMSETVFRAFGTSLLEALKFTKKGSKKYDNCMIEADDIITQFPRLKPYYKELLAMVIEHRRKCNIPC